MTATPAQLGRSWPSRVARHIPALLLAEPWAFFVKLLCIVTGLTTFAGPAPNSISLALPEPIVYFWSATLVLGASAALYGLVRPHQQRVEVAGLIWLATANLVYAGAILANLKAGGLVACGIIAAFGVAALIRALGVYVTYEIARRAAASEVL